MPKIDFFSDGPEGKDSLQPGAPQDDAFAGMQKLDLFADEPVSGPETGAPGVTQLFDPAFAAPGQTAAPVPSPQPEPAAPRAGKEKNIGAMVFQNLFAGEDACAPAAEPVLNAPQPALQQPAAQPRTEAAPLAFEGEVFPRAAFDFDADFTAPQTPAAPVQPAAPVTELSFDAPAPVGEPAVPDAPAVPPVTFDSPAVSTAPAAPVPPSQPIFTAPMAEPPRRTGKVKPIDWSADMLSGRAPSTPPVTPVQTPVAPVAPAAPAVPVAAPEQEPVWNQLFDEVKSAGHAPAQDEETTRVFEPAPSAPPAAPEQPAVPFSFENEAPGHAAFDFDAAFGAPAQPAAPAAPGPAEAAPIAFDFDDEPAAPTAPEASGTPGAQTSEDIFAGLYDADPDDDEAEEARPARAQRTGRDGGSGRKNGRGGKGGAGGKGGGKLPLLIGVAVVVLILLVLLVYNLVFKKDAAPSSSAAPSSTVSIPASSSVPEVVTPTVDPIPRDEWYMKLVNRSNVLATDFTVETGTVGGVAVDSRIVEPLNQMIADAAAAGVNLKVVAGYRSYDRQASAYTAGTTDVPAGASEHNLGLSVDVMSTSEYSYDAAKFEATAEYQWLRDNAANYGFILRYPADKADVTGFAYEPWHYRYVGSEQALKIVASGLTLEEYLAQDAPTGIPGAAQPADSTSASSAG